jgi:3-oxoacyl-[acyl-carrier-protein] synthase-3
MAGRVHPRRVRHQAQCGVEGGGLANVIIGTGSYLPERVVTNQEIQDWGVDYDPARSGGLSLDQWGQKHVGGASRHWVAPGQGIADLAAEASHRALIDAGLEGKAVELIVMATVSTHLPQAAANVQAKLGLGAKFIQLDSGCSGFVDALMVADSLMDRHRYQTALVIAGDTSSYYLHPRRFMDLSVFGDGAGAVVLRRMNGSEYGLRSFSTGSDGDLGDYVTSGGGQSASGVPEEEAHYWRVQFSKVYPWALDRYEQGIRQSVERAGLTLDDVDWVVPHQASARIVHEVADRLGMPREKFVVIFERTGNTVAGSVAIALDEAKRQRKFADGDWLVMPAVGAGMAWNAATCLWHEPNRPRM